MRVSKVILAVQLIALCGLTCYTQQKDLKTDLPLVESYEYEQSVRKANEPRIATTLYNFHNERVTLTEAYFNDKVELAKGVSTRLKSLHDCSQAELLFDQKKEKAGEIYLCREERGENSRPVLFYYFGLKIYQISADSLDLIDQFSKSIAPISCHLNPSQCEGVYY